MLKPLSDVVLVEAVSLEAPLALRLAGALAGRIAGDLGARVFKGEKSNSGARSLNATTAFLDAGKIRLDDDALADALAKADVAIVDSLSEKALSSTPPIIASLSMFMSDVDPTPASEFTLMALGGLLDIVGDPDREPLKLGGRQAAYSAGLAAYTGIAGALCRPREERAEIIRVSMLDTVIWLNWKSVPAPNSTDEPPHRAGPAAEWQVVRCADGWVALVYQEYDWPALCEIVGDDRLRQPRFADRSERMRSAREVAQIIEEGFMRKSRRDLHGLALKHRLPIGPVWSPDELRADSQYMARDFLAPIDVDGRVALTPRLPVMWNGRRFDPTVASVAKTPMAVTS